MLHTAAGLVYRACALVPIWADATTAPAARRGQDLGFPDTCVLDTRIVTMTPGQPRTVRCMDDGEREQALLTALTTEHFVLQTSRSATVTESVGRATVFLSMLLPR